MFKEPPTGLKIEVQETLDGTEYRWKVEEGFSSRLKSLAFSLLMILAAGFFGLFTLSKFRPDPKEAPEYILFIVLAFSILLFLSGIFFVFTKLRRQKPFVLTLSPGRICYKTGSFSESFIKAETANVQNFSDAMDIYRRYCSPKSDIDTSKITNLQLNVANNRQRLTFDFGADRIEIGPTLTEPEREWLYEILKSHIYKGR